MSEDSEQRANPGVLPIDGNKVIPPTPEKQAEIDAATASDDEPDFLETRQGINMAVMPAVALTALGGVFAIISVFALAGLVGGGAAFAGGLAMIVVIAALSFGLAIFIFRKSRIAACIALGLQVLDFGRVVLTAVQVGFGSQIVSVAGSTVVTLLFILAVLACFAYHRNSFDKPDLEGVFT